MPGSLQMVLVDKTGVTLFFFNMNLSVHQSFRSLIFFFFSQFWIGACCFTFLKKKKKAYENPEPHIRKY